MSPYDPEMEAAMKRLYESLNERDRRRYAGVEALKLGPGGRKYIAGVLVCSRRTVSKGTREVSGLSTREVEARIRQPGGGRKDYPTQWPDIDTPFRAVLRDHTAGDPMDETVRWTNLSLEEIATALWEDHDVQVSKNVVRKLLKKHGYRRRKAQKKRTMKQVAHRNEQFENITRLKAEYEAADNPIISLDTKKKENLGNFYREGRLYTLEELHVDDHDFKSFAKGVVIPHGLYDIRQNIGYLHLGTSHDTSEFACDSSFATGGIPTGRRTIPWPPPSWCCVMAAGAIVPGNISSNRICKPWPMKSASKFVSPIIPPTAPNTTPSSIACSLM